MAGFYKGNLAGQPRAPANNSNIYWIQYQWYELMRSDCQVPKLMETMHADRFPWSEPKFSRAPQYMTI